METYQKKKEKQETVLNLTNYHFISLKSIDLSKDLPKFPGCESRAEDLTYKIETP